MKAIAARAIPIPEALDIYFLDCEYPARDDITALEAVMESNKEVEELEKKAADLNDAMAEADEEMQETIQTALEGIYHRLDQLDANTAEARYEVSDAVWTPWQLTFLFYIAQQLFCLVWASHLQCRA